MLALRLPGAHADKPKELLANLKQARPEGRYAYVTIHYEGTPDDYKYILGIRVLINSLKPLRYPFLILCSPTVSQESRDIFTLDGATLIDIEDVKNPFQGHVLPRFEHTFDKLKIWTLTDYDRLIYMDADNIVIDNDMLEVSRGILFCG
jgi:alpha-N-acetylglucosamine transferase